MYKAAVMLLERRACPQLAAMCGAMLAAAGGDAAAQRRALAAVGKLAGHAPEEQAAAMLAAAAEAGADSTVGLSSAAALDLLGLLCSAAQRAETTGGRQQLQQAATACAASQQPLLQTAVLLLPALALEPRAGGTAGGWVQPVSAAVERLASSIARVDEQPAADVQTHLDLLQAAFLPANAVRRVLAAQLGTSDAASSAAQALGAAAGTAASVLELLAGAVGAASRHSPDSSLASQGHAAAVALATAARLRAAAGGEQMGSVERAARWLLAWDLQSYCAGRSASDWAGAVFLCSLLGRVCTVEHGPPLLVLLQLGAAAAWQPSGAKGAGLAGLCPVQCWRRPAQRQAVCSGCRSHAGGARAGGRGPAGAGRGRLQQRGALGGRPGTIAVRLRCWVLPCTIEMAGIS